MNEFEKSIMNGLNEALEFSKGNLKLRTTMVKVSEVKTFTSTEVKAIRENLGYSQKVFADVLGVSNKTIEAWECGKNTPSGAASRLLELISKDPNVPQTLGFSYVER